MCVRFLVCLVGLGQKPRPNTRALKAADTKTLRKPESPSDKNSNTMKQQQREYSRCTHMRNSEDLQFQHLYLLAYSAHADGKMTKLAHATLDPKFNG